MDATLFLTNKSVKILVLTDNDVSFDLVKKVFGELLKNDITHAGIIQYTDKKELLIAVKPDVIIDLTNGKDPYITWDISSGRMIPCIQNVNADMLKKYHEIFLLIDQIKQIKSQLKID